MAITLNGKCLINFWTWSNCITVILNGLHLYHITIPSPPVTLSKEKKYIMEKKTLKLIIRKMQNGGNPRLQYETFLEDPIIDICQQTVWPQNDKKPRRKHAVIELLESGAGRGLSFKIKRLLASKITCLCSWVTLLTKSGSKMFIYFQILIFLSKDWEFG